MFYLVCQFFYLTDKRTVTGFYHSISVTHVNKVRLTILKITIQAHLWGSTAFHQSTHFYTGPHLMWYGAPSIYALLHHTWSKALCQSTHFYPRPPRPTRGTYIHSRHFYMTKRPSRQRRWKVRIKLIAITASLCSLSPSVHLREEAYYTVSARLSEPGPCGHHSITVYAPDRPTGATSAGPFSTLCHEFPMPAQTRCNRK
jgi:hypothetical protein